MSWSFKAHCPTPPPPVCRMEPPPHAHACLGTSAEPHSSGKPGLCCPFLESWCFPPSKHSVLTGSVRSQTSLPILAYRLPRHGILPSSRLLAMAPMREGPPLLLRLAGSSLSTLLFRASEIGLVICFLPSLPCWAMRIVGYRLRGTILIPSCLKPSPWITSTAPPAPSTPHSSPESVRCAVQFLS
jgi:hypothetical protein